MMLAGPNYVHTHTNTATARKEEKIVEKKRKEMQHDRKKAIEAYWWPFLYALSQDLTLYIQYSLLNLIFKLQEFSLIKLSMLNNDNTV